MKLTDKLADLQRQAEEIAKKKEEAIAARASEIGKLAHKVGALDVEDEIIAGALLSVVNAVRSGNNSSVEAYRAAGAAFLSKKGKPGRKAKGNDGAGNASAPGAEPSAN